MTRTVWKKASFSQIPPPLRFVHFAIDAVFRHQVFMGSLLHRLSVLNRNNPVAQRCCAQPVRNHNRCRILVQLQKLLVKSAAPVPGRSPQSAHPGFSAPHSDNTGAPSRSCHSPPDTPRPLRFFSTVSMPSAAFPALSSSEVCPLAILPSCTHPRRARYCPYRDRILRIILEQHRTASRSAPSKTSRSFPI